MLVFSLLSLPKKNEFRITVFYMLGCDFFSPQINNQKLMSGKAVLRPIVFLPGSPPLVVTLFTLQIS